MKSKQASKTGYDHSTTDVRPYSANPRTGERIDRPERFDKRNAAAEKARYPRAGSGRQELQDDQASRKQARQATAEQQQKTSLAKRRGH